MLYHVFGFFSCLFFCFFVVEEGFVNQELQVAYRSWKTRKWIYLGGGQVDFSQLNFSFVFSFLFFENFILEYNTSAFPPLPLFFQFLLHPHLRFLMYECL